jgi:hypothetical protein
MKFCMAPWLYVYMAPYMVRCLHSSMASCFLDLWLHAWLAPYGSTNLFSMPGRQ